MRHPKVLSIVRGSQPGSARTQDPALGVNSFAVADDVEVTLVLKDRGVELGIGRARCSSTPLAGVEVPAADTARDLTALIASGLRVLAVQEDLDLRGIDTDVLLDGIVIVGQNELAELIRDHEIVLTTAS